MFFHFNQNNSGGRFTHVKGKIGYAVIVEADNYEDANKRAENIGLYFDGCDSGYDCPCCGDRWYPQYDNERGDKVPSIYGQNLKQSAKVSGFNVGWWGLPVYVHYKNGEVKEFWHENDLKAKAKKKVKK
jgi:hypothetical protein